MPKPSTDTAMLRLVHSELRDPVQLYLSTLSQTGRRTMAAKLRSVQHILGLHALIARDLCFLTLRARFALQDAGAAPATVNTTLAALKGVARAAWLTGAITAEELQRIKNVRPVHGSRLPRGRAHTTAEISALIESCVRDRSATGIRDAAMIALLYNLGLRRSECVALDLRDYSPNNETMIVRGKGDKTRTAYVVDNGAKDVLADWLRIRTLKSGPLLCPVSGAGGVRIRRLSDQTIYDALVRRARAAGLANVSPHNLRRTFATDLLERGADIGTVKDLMGHASVNTTLIYDRRGDSGRRKDTRLVALPHHYQPQLDLPFGGPDRC